MYSVAPFGSVRLPAYVVVLGVTAQASASDALWWQMMNVLCDADRQCTRVCMGMSCLPERVLSSSSRLLGRAVDWPACTSLLSP